MVDARGIGLTSQRARDRMVEQLRAMGINDERVLDVMRSVPRHVFVDEALASRAYENNALPIGYGQTISQPYIVAYMTAVLVASGPLRKVLEVGAGCGYQSAVLAPFSDQVYAMERVAGLAHKLRRRFHQLGIKNVRVRHGDGRDGWPAQAPFDAILVAAAAGAVPTELTAQLALNGRLVMPVGRPGDQALALLTRTKNGLHEAFLSRVSFVPLVEGVN